MSIFNFRSRS